MTRLPTVGGDSDAWGTVLNDYLTETVSRTALASSPVAGATTFDVAVVPPGLIVGSFIAIDAYTTECELRAVTNISGSTLTVAATRFAHTSGDTVALIDNNTIPVRLYGITGDGTDEWAPLQRLVREAGAFNVLVLGSWGTDIRVQQPVVFETGSKVKDLKITSRAGFAPVDSTGAMCILANGGSTRSASFTASASDNKFTTTADPGHGVSNTIVFNAPYGETLPGGVVAGRIYYIKQDLTGTTFTVSETDGGAELDVTSDGSGTYYTRISSLSRVYWDGLYLTLNIADLNGLWTNLQQPAYTLNTRIEMDAGGSGDGRAIGWILLGQNSYHLNVEVNTSANNIGIDCSGVGHVIRGFNDNGVNNNDVAAKVIGNWHHFQDVWVETVGKAGIWFPDGTNIRAITIDGSNYNGIGASGTFILCDNTLASFELGQTYSLSTSKILSGTGTAEVVGDGVSNSSFSGLWRPASSCPKFKARSSAHVSGDFTLTRSQEIWRANAAGTLTIPASSGWTGWSTTIYNNSGSNVVIDPAGAETIDGASTYTLAPGEGVTIYCTGAAYEIVSKNVPPGALQTYTPTNVTTDRSFDADTVVVAELADVVGTLIADLQARKVIG